MRNKLKPLGKMEVGNDVPTAQLEKVRNAAEKGGFSLVSCAN